MKRVFRVLRIVRDGVIVLCGIALVLNGAHAWLTGEPVVKRSHYVCKIVRENGDEQHPQ